MATVYPMIPRFNYSFSMREAWKSLTALVEKPSLATPWYTPLFPAATVYEISSARTGIAHALAALRLPPRAGIGVQPYTCSSVMVAIQVAGFRPIFIDIDETLTLDPADLARKMTRLDALIVTHTFGIPANIARIRKVVGNLPVIEDCAHAFGSRYGGVQVGNFFDMAVFSFGNGKFPAFGSGGLLVINNNQYDAVVRKRVNALKPTSMLNELRFISRQLVYSLLYSRLGYQALHTVFGARLVTRGKRPDTRSDEEKQLYRSVQGRLRRNGAEMQSAAVKQRRNALTIIDKHSDTFHFSYNSDPDSTCFALVCVHEQRDDLFRYLIRRGIGAGRHFQHASGWASAFGYQRGDCPMFDRLSNQIITIPCHDALTPTDLQIIDEALIQYTNRALSSERLTSFL